MNEEMSDLPQAETADPDGVQVALRAAHTLWSRGDTTESLKWLRKAAESASDEGADLRSLQLAKAAAELRAKLFRSSEPPRSPSQQGPVDPGADSGELGATRPSVAGRGGDEGLRAAGSMSSAPPAAAAGAASSLPPAESYAPASGGAYASGAPSSPEEGTRPSRPITATQYPSHRPRQRMGLSSSAPGARDGGYAAVPSWSADSERRVSSAPPPLPQPSVDDYEELEAEPDDEPADDPGSVWSAASDGGYESWRPPEPAAMSTAASALPPPLPPRGAFADDADFSQQPELPTVVRAPVDEEGEASARRAASANGAQALGGQRLGGQSPNGSNGQGSAARASGTVQSHAWDPQARIPAWDPDAGASWAEELRNGAWGHPSSGSGASGNAAGETSGSSSSPGAASVAGLGLEPTNIEPPPQSETAPARLTARIHHQAVRVSFAPDLRVPGQYVVRPLREGERAATGERIALLVALEPGVPLV